MAGQEAHAFMARTRAQSEDFVRAELTTAQRFEDSLQRQYDGHLRSHVNALQDECREHVGQEDKMRKELQHALTQESSVCQDQLQQALRHHTCQEEYAGASAHQEMEQLRQLISQQAEAMKRFESQPQQYVTQQHEEWTRKHHTQFQQFDGVIRDKDVVIQSLSFKQELANNRERHLQELDQALQDAGRRAQQSQPVFAGTSTQPYATPVEKKTLNAITAVAHAEPAPAFHSPGLSLGASAGNLILKRRTKTPPAAAQRVPSMGLVRRRMRSKPALSQLPVPAGSGGVPVPGRPGGGPPPDDPGLPGSRDHHALPPGLPLQPEVMEVIQEESQMKMARIPQELIKTYKANNLENPLEIQIPVVIMEVEDIAADTRLLLRSISGRSHCQSWTSLQDPPRIHLQKASKVKQIWELWSVNVALAKSTWNDVAVTYWNQVYIPSEESYQHWRRSGVADRFAYEKTYLYGRKAPVPATCDSVEALLRHELLAHIPEWLSRQAGVLGCTSSHTILCMCWKEILVDELHTLPAKTPTSMFQFAAWLEDWIAKLVVADEVAAHIEPRRAMAVLECWETSPDF